MERNKAVLDIPKMSSEFVTVNKAYLEELSCFLGEEVPGVSEFTQNFSINCLFDK